MPKRRSVRSKRKKRAAQTYKKISRGKAGMRACCGSKRVSSRKPKNTSSRPEPDPEPEPEPDPEPEDENETLLPCPVSVNPFSKLSDDNILEIFRYLSEDDKLKFSQVDRSTQGLVRNLINISDRDSQLRILNELKDQLFPLHKQKIFSAVGHKFSGDKGYLMTRQINNQIREHFVVCDSRSGGFDDSWMTRPGRDIKRAHHRQLWETIITVEKHLSPS